MPSVQDIFLLMENIHLYMMYEEYFHEFCLTVRFWHNICYCISAFAF